MAATKPKPTKAQKKSPLVPSLAPEGSAHHAVRRGVRRPVELVESIAEAKPKPTKAQLDVLRMANASYPRSVPIRTSDRTIHRMEQAGWIVATSAGGMYIVRIMPTGRAALAGRGEE